MDRAALADFLRARRAVLQPEHLGLTASPRRRTPGLRREEVASVAGMSCDYYTRLEQARAPQPSPAMLAAIARALRLTLAERDHLHALAGHPPPRHDGRADHVGRGVALVLDRLDTPAMVTNDLGEVLAQNALATALLGDERRFAGERPERSRWYRWFTDPAERSLHRGDDHARLSRSYVAALRLVTGRRPGDQRARRLVELLLSGSAEFARLWAAHDVTWRAGSEPKHFTHPAVGDLELECQVLRTEDDSQIVLVYTAAPGSASEERLRLLGIIGAGVHADGAVRVGPAGIEPATEGL